MLLIYYINGDTSNMKEEQKKLTRDIVKELYLYPHRSKEENIVRTLVWMASWLIGIVIQSTTNHQALGGAYLIFASSLLLEFVPESKKHSIIKFLHGIFCMLLSIMLLGSILLIFEEITPDEIKAKDYYPCFIKAPYYAGWIIFGTMFLCLILVSIEAHKFFYDDEKESQLAIENKQAAERTRFYEHLNGNVKGDEKNEY